jgi:hypothetical protein
MNNMNFIEVKSLESVSFNTREKMVYILIKNEVYKLVGEEKNLISSLNERSALPTNVSLEFLNDVVDSEKAIELIKSYWSSL